jgi:hypothetical protein
LDSSENRSENLEGYEMCCWRRMVRISWTDHVRNEEVQNTAKRRKHAAYWVGHMLRSYCLIVYVTEGKKGQEYEDEDVSS